MTTPENWLAAHAERRPSAPALIQDERRISFADLARRVDAAILPSPGPLGWLGRDPVAGFTAMLAAAQAGAAFFPVDPGLPPVQIARRFAPAGVKTTISEGTWPVAGPRLPALPLDAVRLIIATSGTTGTPKAVQLTGRNLAEAVAAAKTRIPLAPGDVWLDCLPFHTIGGLSILLRCLEAGASALIHTGFDAQAVAGDLAGGRVSHVSLVPAMLSLLLEQGVRPSPRLRHVLVGGAAASPALIERAVAAGWPVCLTYGMSETASQIATACGGGVAPGLAGHPLPGIEARIADDGRIALRGSMVMAGYANPQGRPGDGLDAEGWFATSDLGRLDEHGRLWIIGRADDTLISGGRTIHPAEIESLVLGCPGVRAVAIGGRSDPVWGDRLTALVAGETTPEAFLSWCRDHLPSALRPRGAILVTDLPLTGAGKLDRRRVRDLVNG